MSEQYGDLGNLNCIRKQRDASVGEGRFLTGTAWFRDGPWPPVRHDRRPTDRRGLLLITLAWLFGKQICVLASECSESGDYPGNR